jgi:hypothetical protein
LQTNACKNCSDFKDPRETRNAQETTAMYTALPGTLRFYRGEEAKGRKFNVSS